MFVSLTGLRWVSMDPPECHQRPLFGEFEYEFLLIHRAGITRRVLFRDQKRSDKILFTLLFTQ